MAKVIRVINLPRSVRRQYRRALELLGSGSQSRDLQTYVRKRIREAQEQFGDDLFSVLTSEEKLVVEVIASGAAEIQQIVAESILPERRVEALLAELVDRQVVEVRKKGGKTSQARGAVINLYFVREK